MKIYDELYGEYQLEGVLIELINSPEVQRLKDIHMIGPSYLLNPIWNETRYEHSVGVMLLIKKLGGSLEEQIAGLLHDISHTIFSHVIDTVMKRKSEDYHELIKEDYLRTSTIPQILSKWGYDYKALLLDDSQWKILEQEAPLLCADRMDYTLREVRRYFGTELEAIHRFLSDLRFEKDELVLRHISSGEWFVEQYYKVVLELFYNPLNMYGYEIMSHILAYAMKEQYLNHDDLMKTETEVLTDLKKIKDDTLVMLFNKFFSPVELKVVTPSETYDIYQKKKTRLIDPIVQMDGKKQPTSTYSKKAHQMNEQALAKSNQGVFVAVVTH